MAMAMDIACSNVRTNDDLEHREGLSEGDIRVSDVAKLEGLLGGDVSDRVDLRSTCEIALSSQRYRGMAHQTRGR